MNKKTLTLSGLSNQNVLLLLFSLGMAISSGYLLAHYFQAQYPADGAKTLCNIQGFFSCDAIAYSKFSAVIFGIPNALFGLIWGLFLLASSIFPSTKAEGSNHIISYLNLGGCILLFFYSLFGAQHLCPVCTLYYLFSFGVAFLFYKYSDYKKLDVKTLGIQFVVLLLLSGSMKLYINGKDDKRENNAKAYVDRYTTTPKIGMPSFISPLSIGDKGVDFAKAKIQMVVFSDFECPACGMLSERLVTLKARYGADLQIRYYYYPLDMACNPSITSAFHKTACLAASISWCLKDDFYKFHDQLFEMAKEGKLEKEILDRMAKDYKIEACLKDPATIAEVSRHIKEADGFNVNSTPTAIVNGVKIEGVLPLDYYFAIMDYLRSLQ